MVLLLKVLLCTKHSPYGHPTAMQEEQSPRAASSISSHTANTRQRCPSFEGCKAPNQKHQNHAGNGTTHPRLSFGGSLMMSTIQADGGEGKAR